MCLNSRSPSTVSTALSHEAAKWGANSGYQDKYDGQSALAAIPLTAMKEREKRKKKPILEINFVIY